MNALTPGEWDAILTYQTMSQTIYDTDTQLMLAVQQDDASAFEELMVRFQGRVQSLLRHLVGNRELAEDLTQDVFLRVFQARKSYQPNAKFITWLFTIARNIAHDKIRSQRRRPEIQFGGKANENNTTAIYERAARNESPPISTRFSHKFLLCQDRGL